MKLTDMRVIRAPLLKAALSVSAAVLALAVGSTAQAQTQGPDPHRRDLRGAVGRRLVHSAWRAARRRRDQRGRRRRRAQDRDRLLRQPFLLGRIGARLPARRERGSRERGDRELYQRGRAGPRAVGRTPEDRDDHARRGLRRHHPEHRQGLRAQQIHLPRLPRPRPPSPNSVCDAAKDLLVDGPEDEDGRHHERGRRLDDAARRELREMPAEGRAEGARPHPLLARHHRFHADLQQDRGARSPT